MLRPRSVLPALVLPLALVSACTEHAPSYYNLTDEAPNITGTGTETTAASPAEPMSTATTSHVAEEQPEPPAVAPPEPRHLQEPQQGAREGPVEAVDLDSAAAHEEVVAVAADHAALDQRLTPRCRPQGLLKVPLPSQAAFSSASFIGAPV